MHVWIQKRSNEYKPVSADLGGYRGIGWMQRIDCRANEGPVFRTVMPQKSVIVKSALIKGCSRDL